MGDTKFDIWLSERFRELNTDEDVFVPYIKSIVEGDESSEEKIDALDGILGELAEADGKLDVEAFRTDIISRWEEQQKENCGGGGDGAANSELDLKFQRLVQLNDDNLTSASNQTDEKGSKHFAVPDSSLRAAILNKCQDSSENESDGDGPSGSCSGTRGGGGGGGGGVKSLGLERNTNAERVQDEMKDKRERDKAEAAKKREKDKEDRAKQKQQQQDRKEKAKKKATKVERKAR